MTTPNRESVIIAGFLMAYLGVMGSLMVWGLPLFAGISEFVILYLLIPITAVGIGMVVIGNLESHADK